MVANEVGIDLFDDTTHEACRLMYRPSTSANGEFFFKEKDGELLSPMIFFKYIDWKDASTWPCQAGNRSGKRSIEQQADPLLKEGVISILPAYTIEDAIEKYLSIYMNPLQ